MKLSLFGREFIFYSRRKIKAPPSTQLMLSMPKLKQDLEQLNSESSQQHKTRHPVRGKQKLVLLALYTGPMTERDLCQSLVWDRKDVVETIGAMLRHGLAREVPGNAAKFQLTATGLDKARLFLTHPKYRVLPSNIWGRTIEQTATKAEKATK